MKKAKKKNEFKLKLQQYKEEIERIEESKKKTTTTIKGKIQFRFSAVL